MSYEDRCLFSQHPHAGDDIVPCGALGTWRFDYTEAESGQMWVDYICTRHVRQHFVNISTMGTCNYVQSWEKPHDQHRVIELDVWRYQDEARIIIERGPR